MATKKPNPAVEAVHAALQHHIGTEQALAALHDAVSGRGKLNHAVNAEVIRAKAELLMLSARLFDILVMLDQGVDAPAWRAAQLRRRLRDNDPKDAE